MMSKMPVAGVVWQTIHYLLGFQRLGYEVHYVETHGRTPGNFMHDASDDGWAKGAEFIARTMDRFSLGAFWAYEAIDVGRCFGKTKSELKRLYSSADMLVNLHGGTAPRPELADTQRLIYLETDPVRAQVELFNGHRETIEFLNAHVAHFTFAENYGLPGCGLPVVRSFKFQPTRQPVILDFWEEYSGSLATSFTTVASWSQLSRNIIFKGREYHWSKDREFTQFLDLPLIAGAQFELALSRCSDADRQRLERHGWQVRDGLAVSSDPNAYREYIRRSVGEFTVAKDQNVALRTGWFSDRSATYLAAGRPVITQDTGFGSVLPVGEGLFAFSTLADAGEIVKEVRADYQRHSKASTEIARAHFSYERVLGSLLANAGVSMPIASSAPASAGSGVPADLVLEPRSRRPLELEKSTLRRISSLPRAVPVPAGVTAKNPDSLASVVIVTYNNLALTRLCVAALLDHIGVRQIELILIDNASWDGTSAYVAELGAEVPIATAILNETNRGFPAAVNQGLARATGDVLIILNDDVVVGPGWLDGLVAHLTPETGLVGPVTNRCGNEAEISASYRTYGEFAQCARQRRHDLDVLRGHAT
jgi:hypothetical protein